MGEKKRIKVLIVEDVLISIEAYSQMLRQLAEESSYEFDIHIATNCKSALDKIQEAVERKHFDLTFLDIRIPPYANGNLLSGEDVGVKLKKAMPNVKTIVNTQYKDKGLLTSIFLKIKPKSILIKSNSSGKSIKETVIKVLEGNQAHCDEVSEMICNQVQADILLDFTDRKLLHYANKGAKMSELPDLLTISKSQVESRKRKLKELFDVVGESDYRLFRAAEEKGFL